jgi:Organic solute transporter Ostalpha
LLINLSFRNGSKDVSVCSDAPCFGNVNVVADIVRLLLMVPTYAVVSLASYIFWNHAIPITLVRDSYESFVLYSFFYLLLQYLSPTTEGQKEVFRSVVLQKWIFPFGSVKYRPKDGLYFLQLMKWVRTGKLIGPFVL